MLSSLSAWLLGAAAFAAALGSVMVPDLLSTAWLMVRIVVAILFSNR